jgi:dihydroxy-acid dehydratase
VNLDEAQIAERLRDWQQPAPRYGASSVLAKYARLVGSAAEGAVTSA